MMRTEAHRAIIGRSILAAWHSVAGGMYSWRGAIETSIGEIRLHFVTIRLEKWSSRFHSLGFLLLSGSRWVTAAGVRRG